MDGSSLARRAGAEVVGTALLVFVGAGSVTGLLLLGDGQKPFTGADLGFVALAFGFVVAAIVYLLGPISGGHVNPAVTVALAATRRMPWREVPAYVSAQLVGAVAGALAMWGVFGSRGTSLGTGFGMAFFDESKTSRGSAFLAEALAAGVLLFVVLGVISRGAPPAVAGVVVGVALSGIVLVLGSITCAATNPARVFGPLLVQTVDGSGTHNWLQFVGVYVPAELLGGLLGALGYIGLRGRARPAPPAPAQGADAPARRAQAAGAPADAGRSRRRRADRRAATRGRASPDPRGARAARARRIPGRFAGARTAPSAASSASLPGPEQRGGTCR
jgi:glycerol uptake facilitator